MCIERVVARAFGPLQNEALELGAGMNVVGGPNEAGKTSWHAALRLALTGDRRGPGPQQARHGGPTATGHGTSRSLGGGGGAGPGGRPDHRHQPGPGRQGRLSRARRGAGRRASSNEIIDGAPDATRWLGLDRQWYAGGGERRPGPDHGRRRAPTGLRERCSAPPRRAAATRPPPRRSTGSRRSARYAVGADTVAAEGPLGTAKNRGAAAEASLRRRGPAWTSQLRR